MKTAINVLLSAATLLPAVTADFRIYRVEGGGLGGGSVNYSVFNTDNLATCDQIKNAHIYGLHDDVSPGSDNGLRIAPSPALPPFKVDGEAKFNLVEMGFGDIHFTTYKNRDWGLFNLDNQRVGHCNVMKGTDHEMRCDAGIVLWKANPMLTCFTDTTADDINP